MEGNQDLSHLFSLAFILCHVRDPYSYIVYTLCMLYLQYYCICYTHVNTFSHLKHQCLPPLGMCLLDPDLLLSHYIFLNYYHFWDLVSSLLTRKCEIILKIPPLFCPSTDTIPLMSLPFSPHTAFACISLWRIYIKKLPAKWVQKWTTFFLSLASALLFRPQEG